jgi:class 3 adenylate cyclase
MRPYARSRGFRITKRIPVNAARGVVGGGRYPPQVRSSGRARGVGWARIWVSVTPPSRVAGRALLRRALPAGTVTFLFTDMEGSTKLLRELGAETYAEELAQHRGVVRQACAAWGGVETDTQGDAFFIAFSRAKTPLRLPPAHGRSNAQTGRALTPAAQPRHDVGRHLFQNRQLLGPGLVDYELVDADLEVAPDDVLECAGALPRVGQPLLVHL